VTFDNGTADSGTLVVAVDTHGVPLSRDDPFNAPAELTAHVSRLKDDGTWEAAPAFAAAYEPGPPSRITLEWAAGAGLVDGGRYRVLIESDRVQPPVDIEMSPLTPPSWARHFRLVADASGNLVLANSLNP
jgi:hypothetical protein